MNKKNILYLFLLLVLGGAAWYLITKNTGGTISGKLKDFAVEDTAQITKIFIADREGKTITVERQLDHTWKVNDKFRARKDVLDVLMDVIKRVEVKNPVPNTILENVMRNMATSATKVEIYADDELIKKYYVGGNTPDELGTYMLLEGADKPFVTNIPGFYGYLSIRYTTTEETWRDRAVFRVAPENISEVEVVYPADDQNSFRLKVVDKNYIQLTNLAGDTAKEHVDAEFLRLYLSGFNEVIYEAREMNASKTLQDSIFRLATFCTITVKDRQGTISKAVLARRYIDFAGKIIATSKLKAEQDPERLWILHSEGKLFALGQYRIFDKLTRRFADFLEAQKKR